MLEGYVISWAVTDPVTKEEVVANMPLSEFWRQVGENTIMYDDLGFYLEDGTSLPVNPPAPEPFQGMEEGDIITMLNEYITSDPSGQRDIVDDEYAPEADDEVVRDETPEPQVSTKLNNNSKKAVNGSSRVFLGTVGFVILLILLGDKK